MNDEFLEKLTEHEREKTLNEQSSREQLLMFSGARLNWIGDYVGNPDIKWEEKDLELDQLEFTGNDEFLIKVCERSPKTFQELIINDSALKHKYEKDASFGNETILVRASDHDFVKYKVLDGIHRVIGAAVSGKNKIKAMIPQNENDVIPFCEAHVVYDLIRGFLRNRKNEDGAIELEHALKLLVNTYSNVRSLLENRFNENWIKDEEVQNIIKKVLEG